MYQAVYQLLGLACRAGKLVSGDLAVKDAIGKGKVKLILVAGDASKRTGDSFKKMATKYKIPMVEYPSKIELGIALGKTPRSVAAITGDDFARGVLRAMKGEGAGRKA
ncbi:L7Ae/L30e/S12e/Gadd45 family ribosomal protein [Desulfolucanica intricata]|uniref:L7Ae/L30e/S12e/Gadd45 family ribosomal protein n=1 Tax=Desulfolucanica intricata TaxID=1285191 RepID=UPI00082EE839|nr:ribosomal L7Ae/L30e/S12e/Gadd45 family protein [Desulfolucanica intricata]